MMDKQHEKHRFDPSESDGQSASLMISADLFLLLLALFIVLNSYSAVNMARVQSVFDSVNSAFGFVGAGMAMNTAESEDAGTGEMEEATTQGLRAVLPDLGFSSRKTKGQGSIMTVVVQNTEMDERWPALRSRLGDLLSNNNPGKRHSLQILSLNGEKGTSNLATLASDLEDEGVDASLLAIGYENRNRSAIELRFIMSGRGG